MQEAQEMQVWSLGHEDPSKKEIATRLSILAWRIPWTEEPAGYNPWGHKESNMTECTCTHIMLWVREYFLYFRESTFPVSVANEEYYII